MKQKRTTHKITHDIFSPYDAYGAGEALMEAKTRLQEAREEKQDMSLAEVLPSAQQLSRRDKVRLARILLDEVDAEEGIFPLEYNKSYYIATPYNMFGVAEPLMEAFEKMETGEEPTGKVAD